MNCVVAGCANESTSTPLCGEHLRQRCSPTLNQRGGVAVSRGPYVKWWLTEKAERLLDELEAREMSGAGRVDTLAHGEGVSGSKALPWTSPPERP